MIKGAWHLLDERGVLSKWSSPMRGDAETLQEVYGGTIVRRMPTPRGVHIDGEHDPSVIAVICLEDS